jgi:hypothetical protein
VPRIARALHPGYVLIAELSASANTMPLNRNTLILIVGALIVVVGVLGYMLYDAKKEPTGVQINVGPGGIKIEQK